MIWIFHFIVINILLFITIYTKNKNFFIKSSFIYALFIFGQRWMTGTDFPNYLRYYLVDFQVSEPLYYGLQKFLSSNGLYFGILIFVVFLITLFNNYRFFLKIDKHVVLIIYIYLISELFFAQLSQIRQFIAVSFFINSYYYAYYNKYIKSGINILLGVAFHTSAFFFIPFLFIKLNMDRFKMLYLLVLSVVLPVLDISIIFNLPLFSRYSHYLGGAYDVSLSPFHYLKYYILLIVLFVFVWYVKEFGKNRMEQMILNGIMLNILFYGLSFQFGVLIRVSMYFKVFEFIFLAYYYKELAHFAKPVIKTVILVFFIGIYSGLAVTDPYDISDYEFRHLRVYDNRTYNELYQEVENNEF